MTRSRLSNPILAAAASTGPIFTAQSATSGETLRELPVTALCRSTYQPREQVVDDAEFAALVDSIRTHGVLQPVIVRESGPDQYQLISGERRLEASKRAGLSSIPARVLRVSELQAHAVAVTENLARQDLTAWEEATALARLQAVRATHGEADDVRTLAAAVGRGKSHVGDMLLIAHRLQDPVGAIAHDSGSPLRLRDRSKAELLAAAKLSDPAARAARLVRLADGPAATEQAARPAFTVRGGPATAMTLHLRVPIRALTPAEAAALWTVLHPLYSALRQGVHPRDGPATNAQATA